jgi:hypothetical protein
MVLISKMRIKVKIFLTIALLASFSCEDQGLIVKCPDCVAEEPKDTYLDVKLSYDNNLRNKIHVNVYEGNIEDSVLYKTYDISGGQTTILVTLNKKYTVTASYYLPDNYYTAVDSATPRVKYEKTQCDEPCYYVYDTSIDLRLKYTK